MNKFSFFKGGVKNTNPTGTITIEEFLEILKTPNPKIDQIREVGEEEAKLIKKNLDYATFGGIFSSRANDNLIESSGLACFDVDKLRNAKETKEDLKNREAFEFIHLVFISPSGNGLKIIVKIPPVKDDTEYKTYYNAFCKRFSLNYDNTKDISRACFVSYDSDYIYNPNSKVFDEQVFEECKKVEDVKNESTNTDTSRSGKEFAEVCRLVGKGKTDEEIFEEMKCFSKWKESPESYKTHTIEKARGRTQIKKIFTTLGQVESLYEEQPFFYNKQGMFFIWNIEDSKYELSDEVDILNKISENGIDTVTSRKKSEIVNALKQVGRKKIPKEAGDSWVQFKDKICDFRTGNLFDASPKYFITNPIPHSIGKSMDTPVMDRLFEEWVGPEYVQTLYEIIAYSCSPHQFMQRLIALVGGGSNGKGTFLQVVKRFIGTQNICSSEMRELTLGGFETSAIYRKLVCFLGEISYDDLKNTNQLKKLSGEDDIRFCFKGKTPFTEKSITTIISATNSLPNTPDKTLGFYRRWLIIDFPNKFEGIKGDIVSEITEGEMENLALKIVNILNNLYKSQQFKNEGSFQERMDRYEERSNPLSKFLEDCCVERLGERVEVRVFANAFNQYAKDNHLRVMSTRQITKVLKDDGLELGVRSVEEAGTKSSKYFILNLSLLTLKTNETNETNETAKRFPYRETTENFVSSVSSVSFQPKKHSEEYYKSFQSEIDALPGIDEDFGGIKE